jgi:hypothetical protein
MFERTAYEREPEYKYFFEPKEDYSLRNGTTSSASYRTHLTSYEVLN